MRDDQWQAIAGLLEHGWRGEFTEEAEDAYRVLLGGFDEDQVTGALRVLLRTGNGRMPTASEIVQAIELEPDLPTFDEMLVAVYGPDGALRPNASAVASRRERIAACNRCEDGFLYDEETKTNYDCECRGMVSPATEAAMLERADELGTYISRFVRQVGVDWLRRQWPEGEFTFHRRRDLREEWDRFLDVARTREVYAIAGVPRRKQLANFNPRLAIEAGR